MGLQAYFPRLWTIESLWIWGLIFFLFFLIFLQSHWNKRKQLSHKDRWKMPFCCCCCCAGLTQKQRTLEIPLLKNRSTPVRCSVTRSWRDAQSWVSAANKVWDADVTKTELSAGVGLFYFFSPDGTSVHFNISNFAVVWSGRVHMPWCLTRKKKKI